MTSSSPQAQFHLLSILLWCKSVKLVRPVSGLAQANKGFTLIELLVTIVIVGVLSAIAVPSMYGNIERSKVAAAASEMDSFATGIYTYALVMGAYPADSHNDIPPGTEGYINTGAFLGETPLGGRYNWEGPDGYPYAGVSLLDPEVDNELLEMLDANLDDGDLTNGRFRIGDNGRPTLIIEECGTGYLC